MPCCIRKVRQLIAIAIVAVTFAFAFVATVGVEPAYAQSAPPPSAGAAPVQVTPSTAGLPGASLFQNMLNWLSQAALWGALASLLIGAAIWGLSQHAGNSYSAGKGRTLALAGVIGALLAGLAPTIVNTLFAAAR